MAKRALFIILILVCMASVIATSSASIAGFEIDRIALVTSVHDGDTFNIDNSQKVRLADLDAPELDIEQGAYEARNFLDGLIYGKTVYLDVDDVHGTDSYDRLICVVYVSYNSTHYINVNQALIANGHAEAWDHSNNEFHPDDWTFFVPKSDSEARDSTTLYLIIIVFFVAMVLLVALSKRGLRKQSRRI